MNNVIFSLLVGKISKLTAEFNGVNNSSDFFEQFVFDTLADNFPEDMLLMEKYLARVGVVSALALKEMQEEKSYIVLQLKEEADNVYQRIHPTLLKDSKSKKMLDQKRAEFYTLGIFSHIAFYNIKEDSELPDVIGIQLCKKIEQRRQQHFTFCEKVSNEENARLVLRYSHLKL